MRINETITIDRLLKAVEAETFGLENPGFCTECGEEATGCEPDARGYICEACGAAAVYGAEELLIHVYG